MLEKAKKNIFNQLKKFTCTNKLYPPGMLFIMCRSILSFSKMANPLSIKIGGCVASKLVRKSGGGFCMSTVVTFVVHENSQRLLVLLRECLFRD